MKRTRALIEKALTALLKPHGFVKRGTTWHLAVGGTTLAVWLQGARYSAGAYVNFLAWYGDLEAGPPENFPRDNFHLSFRGDVARRDEIQTELNFDEADVDFDAYVARLDELFFADCLKKLRSLSTLEAAIAACRADERLDYSLDFWNAAHGVSGQRA